MDDNPFYLVGEVYNYGISGGQYYDFGDKQVNYFDKAFTGLINFELKWDSQQMETDAVFVKYDSILNNQLKGFSTLNYLSSHDDGQPFDGNRINTLKAGTMLLLTPGASQTYYGDETARSLVIEGTQGDATLRSFMNWNDITSNENTQKTLSHYQKLGQFRANHPSIGAGRHQKTGDAPYTFSRKYTKGDYQDKVVIVLDAPNGEKTIDVGGVFEDGTVLTDAYSGQETKVKEGKASITSDFNIVLLENK